VLLRLASNGTVVGVPELIANGLEGVTSGTFTQSTEFRDGLYALGDLDGDGQDDLSFGDSSDDAAGTDSGAVYILYLNPGSEADAVKSLLKITPATSGLSGVAPTGEFMTTMSMIGDLDGDGQSEVGFGFRSTGTDMIILARLGSLMPSASPTPSVTPSVSPTPSVTPSTSPTPSISPTPSVTPSSAPLGTVVSNSRLANGENGVPVNFTGPGSALGRGTVAIGDWDGNGYGDLALSAIGNDEFHIFLMGADHVV